MQHKTKRNLTSMYPSMYRLTSTCSRIRSMQDVVVNRYILGYVSEYVTKAQYSCGSFLKKLRYNELKFNELKFNRKDIEFLKSQFNLNLTLQF